MKLLTQIVQFSARHANVVNLSGCVRKNFHAEGTVESEGIKLPVCDYGRVTHAINCHLFNLYVGRGMRRVKNVSPFILRIIHCVAAIGY
jgi:hypothetical protein